MEQLALALPTPAEKPRTVPRYVWKSSTRVQNSAGDRQLCAHDHGNSIEARSCAQGRRTHFICVIGPIGEWPGVRRSYDLSYLHLGGHLYGGQSLDCARCEYAPADVVEIYGTDEFAVCIDCHYRYRGQHPRSDV